MYLSPFLSLHLGVVDQVLHFGLGTHDVVDVSIDFLDGTSATLHGVAPTKKSVSTDVRPPMRHLSIR